MMYRRTILACAAVASLQVAPLWAQAMQMTAAEIGDVLAGNTITGTWGGNAYSQFFARDGLTVYVPATGKREEGRWRVNAQTDEYESWWRSTGWIPYTMVRTGDGHAWLNGDRREPFTVKQGRQID